MVDVISLSRLAVAVSIGLGPVAALAQAAPAATPVYVGTAAANADVVTTNPAHMNAATKPIGRLFPAVPAKANPDNFVALYLGTQARVNAGVVSTNPKHMNGTSQSIGFAKKMAVTGGTQLYVGTVGNCNAGVVTTNPKYRNCATAPVGYTRP